MGKHGMIIAGLAVAIAVAGCATRPARLGDCTGLYQRVAFSPDGRFLAASRVSEGDSVVFDLTSRTEFTRFKPLNAGGVVGLAYAPDGQLRVAHLNQNELTIWNAGASNLIFRLMLPYPPGVCELSPDGRWLAIVAKDRAPAIWEVETARKALILTNGPISDLVLAFSRDGRWLATAGKLREISIWETDTGQLISELPPPKNDVRHVALAPDRDWLAISAGDVSLLCRTNRRSLQTIPSSSINAGARVAGVIWTMVSTFALHPSGSSEVFSRAPSGPVAFSPQGTHLAIINSAANLETALGGKAQQVRVFELSRTQLISSATYDTMVRSIAFSPDGRLIATAGLGLDVWDWANARRKRATSIAFAPVVVRLQTNFPANPAASFARLRAGPVHVSPFIDARPQTSLGERTAALKVKMSDVLPSRPVTEILREAVAELFALPAHQVGDSPARLEIAGTVRKFSVRTPASLVSWTIEVEVELELRVTNAQGRAVRSAVYQGQARRTVLTWPSEKLIEKTCNDALQQLLHHIEADPIWQTT